MKYYLASKRIPKERFWSLHRTGDYDTDHVFNSEGRVCGLRLCTRFVQPLKDSVQPVQLSLFDENEN